MKAVLISIRPKWCEKIFNGQKTIEVRKTVPRLEMPFKVYVYMTKRKWIFKLLPFLKNRFAKVIGEFVCDKIEKIDLQAQCTATLSERWTFNRIAKQACLPVEQLEEYLSGDIGYGWRITEPKLFDKPKELSEFMLGDGWIAGRFPVKRAPQSYVYVEDLKESNNE